MRSVSLTKIATLTGHAGSIYTLCQKEDTFLSGSGDGQVVEWDVSSENGKVIATSDKQIFTMAHLPDHNLMVIGQMGGAISVVDLEQKQEIHNLTTHPDSIFFLLYQKEKEHLIAGSGDGMLTVWSVPHFKLLLKEQLSSKSLRDIDYNAFTKEFVIGSSNNSFYVLDERFGVKRQVEAHQNSVFATAFSADGKFLITGSRDAHIKVWEVEKNYDLWHSIPAHLFTINDIVFNPAGTLFATAGRDKEIRIWDALTFDLLKVINQEKYSGHSHSVNKLLWQEHLISASDDRTVMVWDVQES